MTHLKVINGIKKDKPDYFALYSKVFIKELRIANDKYETVEEYDKDTLKKLIWTGVKMINASESRSNNQESLETKFSLVNIVNSLMSLITPRDFENIFPIDKEYDGEKWGMKDYFYTRKFIEEFGLDRVIGDEIEDFLWDYLNLTTRLYTVRCLGIMSDLHKLETGKGIMEEFFEEQGVPTYTMHEDIDGKKYLEDNQTGETLEVKKPKPRYLKVVK